MALPSSRNSREYQKFVELSDGSVAVRTTATISGDVNVDSTSVNTSGLIGKSSGGDFTVNYTSSDTLTVTGYSGSLSNLDIETIVQVKTDGSSVIYTRDDVKITVSSNLITVTGATFSSTDKFVVYTNIPRLPIDKDLNIIKSIDQSPIWSRYSDGELLEDAQELTSSYTDIGSEIDVKGYTKLGVFVIADTNDSQDVLMKTLAKYEYGGVNEFDLDTAGETTLWSGTSSDFKKYYEIDVGAIPFIQLQVKAGTVGTTAGNLTIYITKKY